MIKFARLTTLSLAQIVLSISLCLCTSGLVFAESKFKYSGFASLGLSYENEDDLALFRDNTQNKRPDKDLSPLTDTQLGLQLSYQFSPKWHATTQLIYADKADYKLKSAVEWAFISYSPVPDLDVRLGRVGVDMFQLSDLRRIDYVTPWVRPPTELYGWIIPYSIDGFDISKSFVTGDVYLRAKLQYGSTNPTVELPDGSNQFETEFNDYVVTTLTAEWYNWSSRISYATFESASITDTQQGLVNAINGFSNIPGPVGIEAGEIAKLLEDSYEAKVNYMQAALNYDDGDWIVNFEVARITSDSVLMPTGNAGYLSLGKRINMLTPYVIYANFQPDRDLYKSTNNWGAGEGLKAAALGIINGPMIDQYTTSLGVRWDFTQRMALKAQWDKTHIEEDSYGLWAFKNSRQSEASSVDVFTLTLNYIY